MTKNQMIETIAVIFAKCNMLSVENITLLHKMRRMKKNEVMKFLVELKLSLS